MGSALGALLTHTVLRENDVSRSLPVRPARVLRLFTPREQGRAGQGRAGQSRAGQGSPGQGAGQGRAELCAVQAGP